MNRKKIVFIPIFLLLSFWGLQAQSASVDKKGFAISKNLNIFNAVFKELNMFYVDSINADTIIGEGINLMLSRLDPYTNYIPESKKDDFKFMTTGEYAGIGSMIMQRDSLVIVSEPYEGMPAQLAGLKAGDRILKVNGKKAVGLKTDQVSALLKGEPNTMVKIELLREGEKNPIVKEVMRKKIVMNAISYYGMVNDTIGYICLDSFTDKAADEVKAAILEMHKLGKLKGLVIDLRDNGGGIMEDALRIVNYFVPKGKTVLSTRGKLKQWDRTYKTTQDPIETELPLCVLVNENSASASEIVSGALQDLDRAVIIGARTFGKGLVQSTRPLPYNGTLKVTTAKYYTPSGRLIQAIDYSKRTADGRVMRIPDSLTNVYHTENGRIVRDGGGIKPDVEIAPDKVASILYYLARDLYFFDFANQFALKHPQIAPVKDFKVSDAIYDDFKSYVKSKNFKYDKESSRILKELKEVAKFEGYFDESSDEFKLLEQKFNHNLDKDLDTFRPIIEEMLMVEIAKRYYYQKGAIIKSLEGDTHLKKAIEIMNNPVVYKKIFTPEKKYETKKK